MVIKGIIFDKDGTLFDFQSSGGPWFYDFLLHLSKKDRKKLCALASILNFDLNEKIFYSNSIFIAGTMDETVGLIAPLLSHMSKTEIINLETEFQSKLTQVAVKNLHNILRTLKSRGYSLAVATNDLESSARFQLRKENLLEIFDCVIGADSGYGAKPEASQLIAVCRSLDLQIDQVIMIGDSVGDLIAAKAADIKSIGVLTGVASRTDLEPYADFILSDISSLIPWLYKEGQIL